MAIYKDIRIQRVFDLDGLAHLRFGVDSGSVAWRLGMFSGSNLNIYNTTSSPTSTFGTLLFSLANSTGAMILTSGSITSGAGNNITLGLGTGGTALTLASSTLAATFNGGITVKPASGSAVLILAKSDNDQKLTLTAANGSTQLIGADYSLGLQVGGSTALTLTTSTLAATFAGSIDTTKASGANYLNVGATSAESGITLSSAGTIKWYAARTTSDVFYLFSSGAIGTVFDVQPSTGNFKLYSTTASSSTSTGALVVSGGVGVAGQVNAGAALTTTGALGAFAASRASLDFFSGETRIYSAGADTSTNGAVGLYSVRSGGTNQRTVIAMDAAGATTIGTTGSVSTTVPATTASTSTTTGSLITAGGLGVAGAGNFGDRIIVTVADTAYAQAFNATSGNVRIVPYVDATNGSTITAYNAGYAGNGPMTFDASALRLNIAGVNKVALSSTAVSIVPTTASSSTTTGSLVNAGGFGNAGSAYIGANLVVTNNAWVSNAGGGYWLASGSAFATGIYENSGSFRIRTSTVDQVSIAVTTGNMVLTSGSLTAGTSTDFTLAGGSSGASLVLGQGASGGATITPKGAGVVVVDGTASTSIKLRVETNNSATTFASSNTQVGLALKNTDVTTNNWTEIDFVDAAGTIAAGIGAQNIDQTNHYATLSFFTRGSGGFGERGRFTNGGNLLIGGTTDITGSGNLAVYGGSAFITSASAAAANKEAIRLTNTTTTGSVFLNFNETNTTATPAYILRYGSTHATLANVLDINASGTGAYVRLVSQTKVSDTTASTSTTTGALVVGGGVGVAGAAYIGSTLNALGSLVGATDDTFLGWDGGNNRVGFTKKNGAQGKLTHGSGVAFVIARSSAADIGAANTFTDELTISTAGDVTLAGDLTVSGGNVGVGGAVDASAAIDIKGSSLTGTAQYGLVSEQTYSSAATSSAYAGFFQVKTAAAAFTVSSAACLYAVSPSLGAASSITTQYGLVVGNQGASGVTNAYGIDISAQSGAATTNIGLRNLGATVLATPAAAVTLSTNSTMTIELTNNTTLTFKVRGTDGTTRSGTVTLS